MNCHNGGCIIKWNIENFHCLKPWSSFVSPVFNLETNQKTQCLLELFKFQPGHLSVGFSLRLKRYGHNSSNVTFGHSCSLGTDPILTQQSAGICTFENNVNAYTIYTESFPKNAVANKPLIIHCYLGVIGDNSFVTNQYKFRTVLEAECYRFKHTIPNLSPLSCTNRKLTLPLPLTCNAPAPFEIALSVSKVDDLETVSVEICRTKADLFCPGVYLCCKLSVFDGESKAILTAVHDHEFIKGNEKWRFPNDISIKNLKFISMKDILTLDFELLISEQKTMTWLEDFTTISNSQTEIASETLEKEKANIRDDIMCLYVEQRCPDIEICADGKKFPAHKAILSARSPVFMAMFENNMQEKEKNLVEISDLDSETVDRMLFFMYSEILQTQEWGNVTKLYVASDKYQIMTLKDKCSLILKKQLSLKNICEALHLADMHCDSNFLDAVQDFIVANDKKVLQSEEWKEFMNSNSKIACQTLHKAWLHSSKKL